MVKDSVVMVLDCGGGTVDITVHKLKCEPGE
jgi:molecular chaperone DnaK (HSP70)